MNWYPIFNGKYFHSSKTLFPLPLKYFQCINLWWRHVRRTVGRFRTCIKTGHPSIGAAWTLHERFKPIVSANNGSILEIGPREDDERRRFVWRQTHYCWYVVVDTNMLKNGIFSYSIFYLLLISLVYIEEYRNTNRRRPKGNLSRCDLKNYHQFL